mmetsp:Transcript_10930/g.12381  ORF Transcript_10930/g.12381 Transcript_10930/m.12381 type:complete len:288 (-) Transcript_10930:27-890(-)
MGRSLKSIRPRMAQCHARHRHCSAQGLTSVFAQDWKTIHGNSARKISKRFESLDRTCIKWVRDRNARRKLGVRRGLYLVCAPSRYIACEGTCRQSKIYGIDLFREMCLHEFHGWIEHRQIGQACPLCQHCQIVVCHQSRAVVLVVYRIHLEEIAPQYITRRDLSPPVAFSNIDALISHDHLAIISHLGYKIPGFLVFEGPGIKTRSCHFQFDNSWFWTIHLTMAALPLFSEFVWWRYYCRGVKPVVIKRRWRRTHGLMLLLTAVDNRCRNNSRKRVREFHVFLLVGE